MLDHPGTDGPVTHVPAPNNSDGPVNDASGSVDNDTNVQVAVVSVPKQQIKFKRQYCVDGQVYIYLYNVLIKGL